MGNHRVETRKGLTGDFAMVPCGAMDDHKSEDNLWSLANYDLNIARKGVERAAESVKTAGSRMRGILAGRSVPPTAAEVAAHYAAGGKWRVVEHECKRESNGRSHMRPAFERTLSEPEHISAYKSEVEDWRLPTTWWALDKGYLLTTWPQVEAQAAVVPEPPAAEPEIIGSGRIEPVGSPGMILAGLPEEFVAADDQWLTTRQGLRYSRKDGVSLSGEHRITPSDLAKINAALNGAYRLRNADAVEALEALIAFEKSQWGS